MFDPYCSHNAHKVSVYAHLVCHICGLESVEIRDFERKYERNTGSEKFLNKNLSHSTQCFVRLPVVDEGQVNIAAARPAPQGSPEEGI